MTVVGRVLVCTECQASVDVLEAAHGASSSEQHQWLDPASYVCGDCLAPEPLPQHQEPTGAAEALGRARTAQQTAKHGRIPFTGQGV